MHIYVVYFRVIIDDFFDKNWSQTYTLKDLYYEQNHLHIF